MAPYTTVVQHFPWPGTPAYRYRAILAQRSALDLDLAGSKWFSFALKCDCWIFGFFCYRDQLDLRQANQSLTHSLQTLEAGGDSCTCSSRSGRNERFGVNLDFEYIRIWYWCFKVYKFPSVSLWVCPFVSERWWIPHHFRAVRIEHLPPRAPEASHRRHRSHRSPTSCRCCRCFQPSCWLRVQQVQQVQHIQLSVITAQQTLWRLATWATPTFPLVSGGIRRRMKSWNWWMWRTWRTWPTWTGMGMKCPWQWMTLGHWMISHQIWSGFSLARPRPLPGPQPLQPLQPLQVRIWNKVSWWLVAKQCEA